MPAANKMFGFLEKYLKKSKSGRLFLLKKKKLQISRIFRRFRIDLDRPVCGRSLHDFTRMGFSHFG